MEDTGKDPDTLVSLSFAAGSHYVAQAGLELVILLQSPNC
jgi:hypothetical protein